MYYNHGGTRTVKVLAQSGTNDEQLKAVHAHLKNLAEQNHGYAWHLAGETHKSYSFNSFPSYWEALRYCREILG